MDDIALVLGEALVDVVHRDGGETALPGGSAANCAVALSRLGRPAWLSTAWAADTYGDLVAQHLAANGVSVAGDPCQLSRTASAVAVVGPDGAASYEFDIAWEPGPVVLPEDVRVVVVACGSLGAVLEPGAGLVRAEVALRRATALTYYDLNVRPAVTGLGPDVLHSAEEMVRLAHLVKGSDEDLNTLWPGSGEEAAARRVFDLGASVLIVTKGERGATWYSPTSRVDVGMVPVTVVDTIGAGDTFGAAVVDALWSRGVVGTGAAARLDALTSAQVHAVLAHAAAAAAVTVSRPGADPPYAAELP